MINGGRRLRRARRQVVEIDPLDERDDYPPFLLAFDALVIVVLLALLGGFVACYLPLRLPRGPDRCVGRDARTPIADADARRDAPRRTP